MKKLKRLLVVMDPACTDIPPERQPPLIRALELADRVGCRIDLMATCYDASVTPSIFIAADVIEKERQRQVDDGFAWLESIARPLREKGYWISSEVTWSYPPAAEISRKALACDADMILKQPAGHNYHIGFFSNTDWDLIRSCPIPCLFTREDTPREATHGILACIDPTREDQDSSLDYQVYSSAQQLAAALKLPVDVINAFELPASLQQQLTSYAPAIAESTGSSVAFANELKRPDYAARHGRKLRAFADHFQIPAGDITVEQGRPADVICRSAAERGSTLIVMGALDCSRLERALLSVSAEPVLSNAPCDVLFIKPSGHSGVMEDTTPPAIRRGSPTGSERIKPVEVDAALADPDAVFTEPLSVNRHPQLTLNEKRRILESWELDEVRLQESAYEGELVSDEHPNRLKAVKTAERLLPETAV